MIRLFARLAVIVACTAAQRASAAGLELPPFPLPSLAQEGGARMEMASTSLLRELHRGGVHGLGDLETSDADYAVLRRDSLAVLAAWLEQTCRSVGFDLTQARRRSYDGGTLARLLTTATGLAALQERETRLAIPIGTLVCERHKAWGDLPGDGAADAYILFATDAGMIIYDPPTRQMTRLADFPNRTRIQRIRF